MAGYLRPALSSDGSVSGSEFQVNAHASSDQNSPMTPLSDGVFVITWMSFNQDEDSWGIYGRGYAADGSASVMVPD